MITTDTFAAAALDLHGEWIPESPPADPYSLWTPDFTAPPFPYPDDQPP